MAVQKRTHLSRPHPADVDERIVADRMRSAGDVHAGDLTDRVGRFREALILDLLGIEIVLNRRRRRERISEQRRSSRPDLA
jgi:hypothetical protein